MKLLSLAENCIECKQFTHTVAEGLLYGCGVYFHTSVIKRARPGQRQEYAKSCICGSCLIKLICDERCENRVDQWAKLIDKLDHSE